MLFPPPGVKIRRTIETQFLTNQPTMIAGHDSRRIMLIVLMDSDFGVAVAFAGSAVGLSTPVHVSASLGNALVFYGPDELWALCSFPDTPPGGNILIQSVFYD